MKLYLVRHGETNWNKARRLQGSSDVPLNQKGIDLARLTGKKLKEVPFDCAYTSPLSRAKDTGEYILHGKDISIQVDNRLIEANFGPYEGHSIEELKAKKHPIIDFFDAPDKKIRVEGAESPIDVVNRAKSFVQEIVIGKEEKYKHMIVFAHGALIHGMLTYIYQRDVKDFWHDPRQSNCAITTIDVTAGKFTVLEEAKVLV